MNFSQALIVCKLGRKVQLPGEQWHLKLDEINEEIIAVQNNVILHPQWGKIILRNDWTVVDEPTL